MPIISEFRLFEVCLDEEKKDIMIRALDNQLYILERSRALRMKILEVQQLKEEIERTKVCQ